MKYFPEDFLWGAAASAPQTEGAALLHGKSASVWDKWFEMEPESFYDQVGPEHTSNTYYHYKEDVALMAKMNLNSYRTSISWTRLLPDGKTVNEEAVEFYRAYFQEMRINGVEPIVNLFHFDMPWWLMEQGGWENRRSTDYFAFYAKTCFELFGDIVTQWATFNEPMVHIECGYLGEFHLPRVHDFKRAIQVGYHTALAHAKAVKAFREVNIPEGKISIILNLSPVYAKSDDDRDIEAKKWADMLYIKSFLDITTKGYFPQEMVDMFHANELSPEVGDEDAAIFKEHPVDFLGVNYYQPMRVQGVDKSSEGITDPSDLFSSYDWPDKKMNPHRGWEIYPEGLYDIAMRLQQDYGNIPWFVSENGMGVSKEERFMDDTGVIQDEYRIEFIEDHLTELHRAIEAGSTCFGYHLWTFVDCWSWLNAYKNRYGYYRVERDKDFARSPKASSYWMAEVIERNGLMDR